MASEESIEKSELRASQREREREQRRLRDRQRRQSMSVEEKENHLARRRRNYQLRRQKVETAHSDSQPEQTSIVSISEKLTPIRKTQVKVAVSYLDVQCDSAAKLTNGELNVESPLSEVDMEATNCKVDELPKSLRLNHIRHIARSLNKRIGSDVIMKENDHNQTTKRLRLTNVKRLARALNNATKQS